jgi:hypothetical protein
MAKKRYQDGGTISNARYPFGSPSPLVQVNSGAADTTQVADASAPTQPFSMKKGGAVKATKSGRGDGVVKRGRTKGRMV